MLLVHRPPHEWWGGGRGMVGKQMQGVRVEVPPSGIEAAGGARKHCWCLWGPYAGRA